MTAPAVRADETWDAGDLGCGELVLELKMRLDRMPPGRVIKLIALDPGAPADVPAWCRMTGHRLLHDEHPEYLIERKPSSGEPSSRPSGARPPAEPSKET